MKRFFLLLFTIFILIAQGREYLIKVATPTLDIVTQLLNANISVIMEMNGFALVTAQSEELQKLKSYRYQILDEEPKTKEYFIIRPIDQNQLKVIAAVVQPLAFDGENFLIQMTKPTEQKISGFNIERTRLTLKPIKKSVGVSYYPQPLQNPLIEDMVNRVSLDSCLYFVRRLQNFRTRYSTTDSCRAAANWVKSKFLEYGCDSVYLEEYRTNYAPNVIGIKRGLAHPDNIYVVICGHMDATSNQVPDFCPGADDNGSGTAAIIEACRVMKDYNFEYSVRYIAFTGEEQGLYGSEAYASAARNRGDSIFGVINYDMVGYADATPENLEVIGKTSNPNCQPFVDYFVACANLYTNLLTQVHMVTSMPYSDHHSFWSEGYVAFCGIEDYWPVNPHYHRTSDTIGAGFNAPDFHTEVIRAGVACLASLANPIMPNVPYVVYHHHIFNDSATGNNNGRWDAGEEVLVYTVLRNLGQVQATNVTADLSSTDPYIQILVGHADFGNIGPLDSAVNSIPYRVASLANVPKGHNANFTLTIQSLESTWVYNFSILVNPFMTTDPIPDGPREPPLYWAYDNTDSGYIYQPVYNWVEINTIGTRLAYAHNDQVKLVNLPPSFGPWYYYGNRYTQISISADGWVAAGFDTIRYYGNTNIPSSDGPGGFVALNFDDLYPNNTGPGGIFYYHDEANHRFIIEYDSVPYYNPRSVMDKFELILYDTTVTTLTGDNIIIAQYQTANRYTSSTVGIEDPTETIGIQYLFNSSYHPASATIAPGRAIAYSTNSPITPIGDHKITMPSIENPGLEIEPNPFTNKTTIRFDTNPKKPIALKIYNATGRCLRHIQIQTNIFIWDGKDDKGKKIVPGVYFIQLTDQSGTITKKAVKVK